jgi:putative zinc finger protein
MHPDDLISRLRLAATGDRQRSPTCPDVSQIAAYVDGTLEPEHHEQVERHLADCEACGGLVGELCRGRNASANEPVPELVLARARRLGKAPRDRWTRFAPHLMAAAIAIVSISVLVHFLQVPEPVSESQVSTVLRTTRNIPSSAAPLRVLSPIAGETVATDQLLFHWTSVPGIRYYEVHIVTDSGELVGDQRVTTTEWRPSAELQLRPGNEYFVRIDAHASESKVVSSVHVPFSVADPR